MSVMYKVNAECTTYMFRLEDDPDWWAVDENGDDLQLYGWWSEPDGIFIPTPEDDIPTAIQHRARHILMV